MKKLQPKLFFLLLFFTTVMNNVFAQSPPNAPSDFYAVPDSTFNRIYLSWTDSSTNETRFVIQKEWEDEFSNSVQIILDADTTYYIDYDVKPNILYHYSLWAENDFGASTEVSASAMVTHVQPPTPLYVTAETGPYTTIKVSIFGDSTFVQDGYEIQHSSDSTFSWFASEKVPATDSSFYTVVYLNNAPFNQTPQSTYYPPNTEVFVRVRAFTLQDSTYIFGPFSSTVSAVTNDVPAAPSGFKATIQNDSIRLTWIDSAYNEAAYLLYRFTGEFSPNTGTLFTLPENSTSFVDPSAQPEVTYNYWLMAIDLYEHTAWPEQLLTELFYDSSRVAKTIITLIDSGNVLHAPVARLATFVTPTSFRASWSSVPGADYYELDVFNIKDSVYLPGYEGKIIYDTTALVTGTRTNKRYAYVVRAVNEDGESLNSNTILVAPIKDLTLRTVCSDDPSAYRRWKVVNNNPVAVPVTWVLSKSNISGTHLAERGESYFYTQTVAGINKVTMSWYDDKLVLHSSTKTATANACVNDSTAVSAVSEKSAGGEPKISVVASPNSFDTKINVKVNSETDKDVYVEIVNLQGQVVYRKQISANTDVDVDATTYPSGIYLLKTQQGSHYKSVRLLKR
jgi:hypothetical protein